MRIPLLKAGALVPGILAVSLASADPAQDYARGTEAYKREDLMTAMRLLEQASGAGHVPAKFMLAYILDQAEENEAALRLYREAAERGHPEAQFSLGTMYISGDGVEKDLGQGRQWYERAARSGYLQATLVLALAYLEGNLGVKADREQAIDWLRYGEQKGFTPAKKMLSEVEEGRWQRKSTAPDLKRDSQ